MQQKLYFIGAMWRQKHNQYFNKIINKAIDLAFIKARSIAGNISSFPEAMRHY